MEEVLPLDSHGCMIPHSLDAYVFPVSVIPHCGGGIGKGGGAVKQTQ